LKKLGGNTKTSVSFTVPGDSVTFAFRSDTSNSSYYGYYAVVSVELKATPAELNYLHTEEKEVSGWYLPKTGDGVYGNAVVWYNSTKLGLISGNTYTVTFTSPDGETYIESIVATDASSDIEVNYPVIVLESVEWESYIFFDGVHYDISGDEPAPAEGGSMWYIPAALDCASVMIEGTGTNGPITHIEYKYGKVPYENLELIPVVEQYYEWTSSDVIPVKGQITVTGELLTFKRPSPLYTRCEVISRWKEINRSDVFDEYISPSGLMAVPFDANGEYASVEGTYITGNASDSVYLGTGEETTTTAYNEWYVTEQYTILFDEKGMFIRQTSMAAPDEGGTTKTITATEDYPSYAIRSYAYGVDRNSDINPFTNENITWGFLTSVRKTRGSYIQLRWYQD
jgi:hypothetical protein